MKNILITGANGFIATQFIKKYQNKYKFTCVSHKGPLTLKHLESNPKLINDIDVVLNFAGSNIGAKRWTVKRKDELLSSRIITTDRLVKLFNQYNSKAHFINASAIGIYDPNILSDDSTKIEYNRYDNFSMQLVKQWEQSALRYTGDLTITRFGVVLSSYGGAFSKILRPFLFYVGGRIGNGLQSLPWISLVDLLNILDLIIINRQTGVYNLVAPQIITNQQLTNSIGKIWKRPTFINMPAVIIKLLFGQMGEELFLNNLIVKSLKLETLTYKFNYPNIDNCLQAIKEKKT